MFFVLSKLLGFFATSSNLVMTVGLVGLLLTPTRFARAGRRLATAGLIGLALLGLSPLGNILILPLEQRFPAWNDAGRPPDGIIVLGGAIIPDISAARDNVALDKAAERVTAGAALALRYPQAKVVYSGGTNELFFRSGSEAVSAVRLFQSLGIPPERIIAEEQSRNTVENAVFSRLLAMPQPGERWILITSAYHMPRAIGVFRAAGFPVEAYPVDWRTRGPGDAFRPFESVGRGLERADTAVHEWVGLLVYWLTGRSASLFPGPQSG
jgi:uncharacterized SAM-binding protein YcdF (DUF218 family)